LEDARELAGEPEAERMQVVNYELKRAAFRAPDRDEHHRAPTEEEMDRARAERERRRDVERSGPPPVSPLAAAVRDYLLLNPRRADESAGWIATTLWAEELFAGKPTRDEVTAALDELGGDDFRLQLLRDAKEVVPM
jgi:hypothetical protein